MNTRWICIYALLITPLFAHAADDAAPKPAPAPPPVDLIAIDTMARHHEATQIMARVTAAQSTSQKTRALAQRIMRAAAADGVQLKTWRARWYAKAPRAIDGDAPGMAGLQRQLTLLADVPPDRLDAEFLEKMISHSENGIRLSTRVQTQTRRVEIKNFARAMKSEQTSQLKQLRRLLAAQVRKQSPAPAVAR